MKYLSILCLLISVCTQAQWKSYRLVNNDRDTINCIDNQDRRQGRWVIKVDGLRGEPGYDEEGIYKDGKKEGMWRCYTSMGDLYAVERFRWGNKDGKSMYYDIAGLEREESWKAVNPDNPYDTVDVFDPIDPTKVVQKVVKVEGTSVKHGVWKYYDSRSGGVTKSESYFLGKTEEPKLSVADSTLAATDSIATAKPKIVEKPKPKEVQTFEKKKGNKNWRSRDGATGM